MVRQSCLGPMRRPRNLLGQYTKSSRVAAVIGLALMVMLTAGGQSAGAQAASASNGKIAFSGNLDGGQSEIYTMSPDGSNITRLTNNASPDTNPAWSPDGSRIAFTSSLGYINVMNADGSNETRLTNTDSADFDPTWSPDGSRIAFWSSRDGGVFEIYVMNADGASQTRLTVGGSNSHPAWSPDGTRIAFRSSQAGGPLRINVMNADGSNRRQLTASTNDDSFPTWSPDSTKIAFTRRIGSSSVIYVMNADGTNQTQITPTTSLVFYTQPEWSPDGNKIAFASNRDGGQSELYVMNSGGANVTRLTFNSAFESGPAWQSVYITCEAGQYNDGSSCVDADPGSFVATAGATSQTACSVGTFQDVMGQSSCKLAPVGSFVDTTGASLATRCPVGTYQDLAGQISCTTAPIGSFVDTTGATAATLCPAGTTTLVEGATSIGDCVIPYRLIGFSAPVDSGGVVNQVRAGQTVPLKWRLTTLDGVPVTNLAAADVRLTVSDMSCSNGATVDALEEYAAGSSGLQNLGDGYYQWNWRTLKSYAGSCKTMLLSLGGAIDVTQEALFGFTQ